MVREATGEASYSQSFRGGSRDPPRHGGGNAQNLYRNAAQIRRLPPLVAHWFRKFAELIRPSGIPKFRVLVALNISMRIWMFWRLTNRVFLMIPMSTFSMPSARSELRGTLPTRSPAQVGLGFPHNARKSDAPPAARSSSIVMLDRSRFEFKLGRMAFPTSPSIPARAPVGSEPFSTVNGAPLWKVKNALSCQPPRTF